MIVSRRFMNVSVPQLSHTFFRSVSTSSLFHSFSSLFPPSSPPLSVAPPAPRVWSARTLRKQALAQTTPFYLNASVWQRLKRGGFDKCIVSRPPPEHRAHKPGHLIRQLRHEHTQILNSDKGRQIADFKSGDKIVVTKYYNLNDKTKYERISGVVLARENGTRLSASFLLRCYKLGQAYEIKFPLHSPFIARIDVVSPSTRYRRAKLYNIRSESPDSLKVKLPDTLPKPNNTPVTINQIVAKSAGKTKMLEFQPMKKFIPTVKFGGEGAVESVEVEKKPPPAKGKK